MIERRVYDASLPLFACWSLESPIYTAVVFLQIAGNEVRAIGSRYWKLKPLHTCIEDVAEQLGRDKWRVRTHITPADPDGIYAEQFEDAGMVAEESPKVADIVTLARRLFSVIRIEPEGNDDLIDAINSYAPREEPHGFVVTSGHTLARYFVRALEVFAAWRHDGGGRPSDDWSRPPDYSRTDRMRI